MAKIKLENAILVTEEHLQKTNIVLQDGYINLSGTDQPCDKTLDLTGKYILPGFIDIHFHGYNLFDFTLGLYNPKAKNYDQSESAFSQGYAQLCKTMPRFGLTGCFAATISNGTEKLKKAFANMRKYLQQQEKSLTGTRIFGGLLEGSFISKKMAGAQNPDYVLEPSPDAFDRLCDNGTIKLALVAPDAGEDSLKLTEYLTKKGIIVATGHTNATCKQVEDAIKAGLKYCIHFTNGPTGGSYKPFDGGGTIEAVLKHDDLFAEQILDGCHVNPAYVRDIIKRKGTDKIIGVTDCIWVAGSDIKQFDLAGTKGEVSPDGRFIRVVGKPKTLCSSNLTMDRAFENILNWLSSDIQGIWNRSHPAMPFEEALVAAAKVCSTNACEMTGLKNKGFGHIADVAIADICVLNVTGSPGNYKAEVEFTIINGNIVYSKN